MVQKTEIKQGNVQTALEEELARLKEVIPFGRVFDVRWTPRVDCKFSGELVGDTIYVYEENLHEAINTLKHEYIDCLLTQKIIEPLLAIVNAFIKLKAREIYAEKERIVTDLLKFLNETT